MELQERIAARREERAEEERLELEKQKAEDSKRHSAEREVNEEAAKRVGWGTKLFSFLLVLFGFVLMVTDGGEGAIVSLSGFGFYIWMFHRQRKKILAAQSRSEPPPLRK